MTTKHEYNVTQETINAIEELGVLIVNCSSDVLEDGSYWIHGKVQFADGHCSTMNVSGKTMEEAEEFFLHNIIKRTVPKDMFEETCNKYGVKTNRQFSKSKGKDTAEILADTATKNTGAEITNIEAIRESRTAKNADVPTSTETNDADVIKKYQQEKYDLVMNNVFVVGNKKYAYIPLDLLYGDEQFQRLGKNGSAKVQILAAKWNKNKCDALRVSPHNEQCKFSIIDGFHRYKAAGLIGIKGLVCEILDMPNDPVERLKEEAFLFATQNDELDKLSPVEKHKAYLILGNREHVILDNTLRKHGISLKINSRSGKVKCGHLAAYKVSLDVAKSYGEEVLDNVFDIICGARWHLSPHGTSDEVVICVKNMLVLHPERRSEIIEESIKLMKRISPADFIVASTVAYPKRRGKGIRCTLYLEDYLCDKIGMERVYLADKEIERHSINDEDVPVGVSAS